MVKNGQEGILMSFIWTGIEKKGVKINYPDGVIKEEGILFNEKKNWTMDILL